MTNNKKSYYAVIPAEVRYDKRLSPNAKLLYGEISALSNEEGFCWASNKYFQELYGASRRSIQGWIGELETAGHIYSKVEHQNRRKIYLSTGFPHLKGGECKNLHGGMQKFAPPPRKNLHHNITFNNTNNIRKPSLEEEDRRIRSLVQ